MLLLGWSNPVIFPWFPPKSSDESSDFPMIPIDSPCFFPWKSLQFGPVVANQATHHHTVEARDQRFAREIEP